MQTDVVDSTRLAEQLGDAASAALWQAHDRLARDLLQHWRGTEIDKSDGFLLLFGSATDAVGFARAYHRALATLEPPLQARTGLHAGPLTLRENPAADIARGAKPREVEGLAKPTTARVMSLARGGQTLLTDAARRALGATPLRVQSHGHWRLKGLQEPIELFEVGDDDAPFVAPPDSDKVYRVVKRGELWLPAREVAHSLPAERDAFVGRQAPLQDLARRFEQGARLVTLLGPGGTGKTRLAQHFGWRWLGDFPGGVWFCDLAPARGMDGIVQAVAQGLDLRLGVDAPVTQIGHALAGRGPCLVIVDNFEQVSRHAEASLGRWLDRAPQARFIVTTREVLGIAGEAVLALAPLAATDAAELFMRRAAAAQPGFNPGAEDRAAIESLVVLLDGLPLAIELAAARVRVLPPRALLQRMDQRFRLLTSSGGRRDRQATLRATIDWSWDLLTAPDKTALAQLSVFEGGFTLAAAEQVLDLSACDAAPWPTDAVQQLVEKSLLRQVCDQRFDLLLSVRDYAGQRLGEAGSFPGAGPAARAAAEMRHWQYFAALDEHAALADHMAEIGNLEVACRRAAAHADAAAAAGALARAWAALALCGPFTAALELARSVRAMSSLTAAERATADWVAGCALEALGRGAEAHDLFESGLAAARQARQLRTEALLLCALGEQHAFTGHVEQAQVDITRGLELAHASGDKALQCKLLNALGALANDVGRSDEASARYESALTLARELDDPHWQGGLLGNLGILHLGAGRLDQARDLFDQGLALAQRAGDRRWEGNTRCNLGLLDHLQGQPDAARAQFEAACQIARQIGHLRLECTALCNLGLVASAQGAIGPATAYQEQALRLALELADRRLEGQVRGYLGLLLARQGRLADARADLASAELLLREADDRASLGLVLCSLAETEHLAGQPLAAAAALERAQALARQLDAAPTSELSQTLAQTDLILRSQVRPPQQPGPSTADPAVSSG